MYRAVFPCVVIVVSCFFVGNASAQQQYVQKSHPILGKWQWTQKGNGCTEAYDFRRDGTAYVISGQERSDNTFTIAPEPDANGFFEITMKMTKDYGGKDCADSDEDTSGQETTTYILFEPSKTMFIWCKNAEVQACFGPLKQLDK
jgi:hypothetical protein